MMMTTSAATRSLKIHLAFTGLVVNKPFTEEGLLCALTDMFERAH